MSPTEHEELCRLASLLASDASEVSRTSLRLTAMARHLLHQIEGLQPAAEDFEPDPEPETEDDV